MLVTPGAPSPKTATLGEVCQATENTGSGFKFYFHPRRGCVILGVHSTSPSFALLSCATEALTSSPQPGHDAPKRRCQRKQLAQRQHVRSALKRRLKVPLRQRLPNRYNRKEVELNSCHLIFPLSHQCFQVNKLMASSPYSQSSFSSSFSDPVFCLVFACQLHPPLVPSSDCLSVARIPGRDRE